VEHKIMTREWRIYAGLITLSLGMTCGTHVAQAHDFRSDELNNLPDLVESPQPEEPAGGGSVADNLALRGVIDQYKLWEVNQPLTVCFFGGGPEAREFIAETSRAWDDNASISFDFGQPPGHRDCDPSRPSHIRIAFENDGNWSYIGTDSVRVRLDRPSLNLGILAERPFSLVNKDRLRGTILHELGHALALLHEHQSPEANCESEMRWEVVYADLEGPPNNWDRATVDRNLRQLVRSPRLRTTAYDRGSNLHYSLPARWFIHGINSSCWGARNDDLSETDVQTIRSAYPETLAEQAAYIAQLDAQTMTTVAALKIPQDKQAALLEEIRNALSGNEALKAAGVTSNFLDASVKVKSTVDQSQHNTTVDTQRIQQRTEEKCSPAIAGVGGNVTTDAKCP
jgi:hypothetical protein